MRSQVPEGAQRWFCGQRAARGSVHGRGTHRPSGWHVMVAPQLASPLQRGMHVSSTQIELAPPRFAQSLLSWHSIAPRPGWKSGAKQVWPAAHWLWLVHGLPPNPGPIGSGGCGRGSGAGGPAGGAERRGWAGAAGGGAWPQAASTPQAITSVWIQRILLKQRTTGASDPAPRAR